MGAIGVCALRARAFKAAILLLVLILKLAWGRGGLIYVKFVILIAEGGSLLNSGRRLAQCLKGLA